MFAMGFNLNPSTLLWEGFKKALHVLSQESFRLDLDNDGSEIVIQITDTMFPESPSLVHRYEIPEGESPDDAIINAIADFFESIICDAIDYEILQEDKN